ncbi:MAG: hypothetical protein ACPLKP_03995, partial [Microgenomates group bacterium]
MEKRKRNQIFLILLTSFLFFSLFFSLKLIKSPVKLEKKAEETPPSSFPIVQKFTPPPINHVYQIIAHGFHNFIGNTKNSLRIGINGGIYDPTFISFVNQKICDISNGLEGEESLPCNVKQEGGIQIVRLSGQVGLVVADCPPPPTSSVTPTPTPITCDCNFGRNFETINGKLIAKYPNRRTTWDKWINLIKQIREQTNADIFVSIDFPEPCESNTSTTPITENDLKYFTALIETAFIKLRENNLPTNSIKYWNPFNEPGVGRLNQVASDGQYLISIATHNTATIVKQYCPDCKIVLGGPPSIPFDFWNPSSNGQRRTMESFFSKFFNELKSKNTPFEAFDLHWHHQCLTYPELLSHHRIVDYLNWYKNLAINVFGANVINNKEFLISENSEIVLEQVPDSRCSSPSVTPTPTATPVIKDVCGTPITQLVPQKTQAEELIKRLLIALGGGIKKISYNSALVEDLYGGSWCNYWSHVAILDYNGNERLSFKGLEILAEKIYGATNIQWNNFNRNPSENLEIIRFYYDNDNQNPGTVVFWTRDGQPVTINNPQSYLGLGNNESYLLNNIENNQWRKSFINNSSLTANYSPIFISKAINCTSLNINFTSNQNFTLDPNNIPTLTLTKNQNQQVNLNVSVSSSERKIRKISLRIKTANNPNCVIDSSSLVATWISPSLVKEINGSLNLNILTSKEEGEYYLFPVVSDDVVACSGDPSANSVNSFCTARRGKIENKIIKVKIVSPTVTPTNTPTPTPTNTPTPTPTPTNTPTPTATPTTSPGTTCPQCLPLNKISYEDSLRSDGKFNKYISWNYADYADGFKIFLCSTTQDVCSPQYLTSVDNMTFFYVANNNNQGFAPGTKVFFEIRPFKNGCQELDCEDILNNFPTSAPTPTPSPIPSYLTLEFTNGTVEREVQTYYQDSWYFGGNQLIKIPQGYSGTIVKIAVQVNHYGDNVLTVKFTEKTATTKNYNPQERTTTVLGTKTNRWVEFEFNYPV